MIRNTIMATKMATFCVELPNASGNPSPIATGFFVSSDGWFVTAAHVVAQSGNPTGPARTDLDRGYLRRPGTPNVQVRQYRKIRLDHFDPVNDFALLKLEWADHLPGGGLPDAPKGFDHLTVSIRVMDEGEPVYSYGYPLAQAVHTYPAFPPPPVQLVSVNYSARLTSAVISSHAASLSLVNMNKKVLRYVIDKPLNFGNSGGPIVASETGKVFALCSAAQMMAVPQPQLVPKGQPPPLVMVPSLYGIVSSLSADTVVTELRKRGIAVDGS
jgi:serine protease Do